MPSLHLIAGPNGAGKSTLYQFLVGPRYPVFPFVNAQAHAAELKGDPARRARAARNWADEQAQSLLRLGQSFVMETAFSHPSRVALIAQARALGFDVVLYALALDEPRHLLHRVNQRMREGGHAVPTHKVLERYVRCMDNFRQAVFFADMAFLIDAGDAHAGGPRLIATVSSGQVQMHAPLRPRWVDRALGFSER
ncbi:AAA family ATPase [Caenimonas aquaedulcis]|uniref:Zeta toxin family protein n=1 Tax=Caenimonas aquaedulcis TaxID=2793270 RepID=A0A931H5Q7_9BURK|nr:AAA family ATPase [Caenimonas aquaedulcis]MBG9388957.1 zeta toxin family protein [Caenimonas aquaedulcis]